MMSFRRKQSNVSENDAAVDSAAAQAEPMMQNFHPFAKIKNRFMSFGNNFAPTDIEDREDIPPGEKRQLIIGAIISAAVVVFALVYLVWRASLV